MMRKSWCIGFIVVMVAIALSGAAGRADILVRTDGGLLDGKVLSQNAKEVVFQADGADASAAQHLERTGLARVLITDEHGALISDSSAPATQPASRWNVPAEPTAPPVSSAGTRPTYLVIPLHGEVGETVLAGALEKSLEDAVRRKPTVVVLDINSPGGLVEEAKRIIDVLHRYNKKLRIVALTGQDLSAAAILSLSVREIYVKSSSTIGAATSYIPNNMILPPKIEEKMQSAWRAVARNSAEEGKHETLLAEAMIDNDLELHLETVGGKATVKEGHGDRDLCRKGKILTLSSHEAVECGLAAGEADDIAELGTVLKFPNWTEIKGLGTLLADSLPKRADAYKTEMESIRTRFERDITVAVNADPSDSVTTATRVVHVAPQVVRQIGPGRHVITHSGTHEETITVTRHHSPARWKSDSLACVVALQQSEADVKDAISLSAAYGRGSDVEMLKDASDKISAMRATVFDNRNKYGQGEVIASKNPASSDVPSGANPNPAAAPPKHGVPMPPGSVKTALVGGHGGGAYFHLTRNNAPAIGFRYAPGEWGGKAVMKEIDPAYGPRPPQTQSNFREILAKDGYIAGGLIIDADDTNVVAFKVIFIGYKDGVVNKKDTYTSDWQGTPDGNPAQTLAGNGEVILGTIERRGMNQDAIGLVVIPPGGKIMPAAAESAADVKPNLAQNIDNLKIPDAPTAGSIHGSKFKPDRAELQGGWLTLRQGTQFFPDLSLRIHLALKSGEGIDGRTYRITPDQRGGPQVRLTWMPDGEKLPKDVFYPSCTLILEFGKVVNGKAPGKIYVIVPDEEKSFVAGTFNAELK